MVRKTFITGLAVLTMATASQATIIMSNTATPVGQGFTLMVLHAHATAGEIISGVDTPSIVSAGGPGASQVWLNGSGTFKSATAGDQTPGLWNSAYTPYDSFWLFDMTNSLSIGAGFDESNNGVGGVTGLPNSPLGAPYTGFGNMGTVGGAAGFKSFTVASGKIGTDVDLAHIVVKTGSVRFNGTMRVDLGTDDPISYLFTLPEPATCTLLSLAMAGCFGFIRRR